MPLKEGRDGFAEIVRSISGHIIHRLYPIPILRTGTICLLIVAAIQREDWTLHIIGADCRTVPLSFRRVRDREMLLRIVARPHGDPQLAAEDIRRWGRGSVSIDPSPAQCKALGIRVI